MSLTPITLLVIKDALLDSKCQAFRRKTILSLCGGDSSKVYPPTYASQSQDGEAEYLKEERYINKEKITCVCLDSNASQANRMEKAINDSIKNEDISKIPLVYIDYSGMGINKYENLVLNDLDCSHRVADANFRDSVLKEDKKTKFNDKYKWTNSSPNDATEIFKISPFSLVFGTWGGTKGPGIGNKFERIIVSEIMALDVLEGKKSSGKLDQFNIKKQTLYVSESKNEIWTTDEEKSKKQEKGKKPEIINPSDIGHGNIPPTIKQSGGVSMKDNAESITTLSLVAIRNLNFPFHIKNDNILCRTLLATMALCGATLMMDNGHLRSGRDLKYNDELKWELLKNGTLINTEYSLDRDQSIKLLKEAIEEIKAVGIPWNEKGIHLVPGDKLVKIISNSTDS